MKLFILVPEIDEHHTALAHLPTWIRKLSEKFEVVYVFTLKYKEETKFPENVRVYCPENKNKIYYFLAINHILFKNTIRSDAIFCLMYPMLTIWASPYAKLFRKPIVTWYAHAAVPKKLKQAHSLANIIVTSSKDGCRLESSKIRVIGQAIDTDKFSEKPTEKGEIKKILYLGRISPVKGIENLVEAANILINQQNFKNIEFEIVGDIPSETDRGYYNELKDLIKNYKLKEYFKFKGSIHYSKVVDYYQSCDIFVNPSYAGSLEKTVIEAMACGKMVITSNEAYYNIFNEKIRERCYFRPDDYEDLAMKIERNLTSPSSSVLEDLKNIVHKDHSLESWSNKLKKIFEDLV